MLALSAFAGAWPRFAVAVDRPYAAVLIAASRGLIALWRLGHFRSLNRQPEVDFTSRTPEWPRGHDTHCGVAFLPLQE
jgi:hypothetical protein